MRPPSSRDASRRNALTCAPSLARVWPSSAPGDSRRSRSTAGYARFPSTSRSRSTGRTSLAATARRAYAPGTSGSPTHTRPPDAPVLRIDRKCRRARHCQRGQRGSRRRTQAPGRARRRGSIAPTPRGADPERRRDWRPISRVGLPHDLPEQPVGRDGDRDDPDQQADERARPTHVRAPLVLPYREAAPSPRSPASMASSPSP